MCIDASVVYSVFSPKPGPVRGYKVWPATYWRFIEPRMDYYTDRKDFDIESNHNYPCGYHFFENKADAASYSCGRGVYLVEGTDIVAEGVQHWESRARPAFVAKTIKWIERVA